MRLFVLPDSTRYVLAYIIVVYNTLLFLCNYMMMNLHYYARPYYVLHSVPSSIRPSVLTVPCVLLTEKGKVAKV